MSISSDVRARLEPLFASFARRMEESLATLPSPGLNAAILIGDEVVWSHAAGYAQFNPDVALTPEHLHRIGSITKLFTSHAILLLRDDGLLDLDAPVSTYIPEFEPGVGVNVTLRHMLCHGSGISSEGGKDYWGTGIFPDEAQFVELVRELRPLIPPMTQWKYSNAAMSMLGLVIQRVSGIPYERFIEERLLAPLGMKQTAFYPGPEFADRLALGHYLPPYQRRWEATPYQDLKAFNACGMLASTPSDLLQLARLQWAEDSFLPTATRDEMLRLQIMDDGQPGWQHGFGLGWRLTRHGNRIYAGHSGQYLGNNCDFHLSVEHRVAVAFFTMYGGASTQLSAQFLTETIDALGVTSLPPTAPGGEPVAPAALPWLGAYTLGPWFEVRIEWRRGGPQLVLGGMPGARLVEVGPDRLRIIDGRWVGEDLIVRRRDESGRVVELSMAGVGPITRI